MLPETREQLQRTKGTIVIKVANVMLLDESFLNSHNNKQPVQRLIVQCASTFRKSGILTEKT